LLVGGIGVMNIMMVSVTERTREIGIRMALGAKGRIIRFQFLTEAVIVSLCGGIIGVILGLLIGSVASNMLHARASVSPAAVLISVGFSMMIGVFFGYAPANKASKLDPIEALRYE
ncbi:MAG: FtsX-like permease family protein, partial [Erysipelotrichia bacterium]|nr:FtsX-like permease family protein [Erysipelotrichia bacterium]